MIRTEVIGTGRLHGFIAHADNPVGGVLVLPTITAVDAPMQERARLLAEAGFTALVWNPYPGQSPPADLQEGASRARTLSDGALDDMHEGVEHLRGTAGLKSVGVIGFCLGGRYAVLLAAEDRELAACISYYPSIRVPMKANETRDAIAEAAQIACPVHLVHGTRDTVFTNAVFGELRTALEGRQAPTIVQVHPDAVHSFMRPDLQLSAANSAATRLSWPQTIAFLQACVSS